MIADDMSCDFDVNGAAMDASASERDRPTSAVFNAVQSFAPSPTIPTTSSIFDYIFYITI
jgi:hypothetical protein